MIIKTTYTVILLALALLSPSFGPCDESLPTYQEPNKVFSINFNIFYEPEKYGNRIVAYVVVENVFDETLQGTAAIHGTVEIVSARDSTVKKTFQMSGENVIEAKGYDRRTGILTIDPQDTVRLGVSWGFIDDSGRDLRENFFQYYVDPTCEKLRKLTYMEYFICKGKLTVFTKTGSVQINPEQFTLCYVTAIIKQQCPAPPPCKPFPY